MGLVRELSWPDAVTDIRLHPVYQQVILRLREIIASLPPASAEVKAREKHPNCIEIDITPSNSSAAAIQVYLADCDPRDMEIPTVVICAGKDVGIDVADVLYDDPAPDVATFFADVVKSIVCGRLHETLHYRGETLCKSTFVLKTEGKPLTLTRTNVPNVIKALVKPRSKKTVSYAPYHG